jgi:hypothetical protein
VPFDNSDAIFDPPSALMATQDLAFLIGLGGETSIGSPDDFERPVSFSVERGLEFSTGVATIGEDVAQPREGGSSAGQDAGCTVAVLNVGGMDERDDQQAHGVGEDMPLAAFDCQFFGFNPPSSDGKKL